MNTTDLPLPQYARRQPGVSMAAVALAHGLNANVLRRWVVQSEPEPGPA